MNFLTFLLVSLIILFSFISVEAQHNDLRTQRQELARLKSQYPALNTKSIDREIRRQNAVKKMKMRKDKKRQEKEYRKSPKHKSTTSAIKGY